MSPKPKIALIRGKYLNNFEMQNYVPLAKRFKITAFASLFPIHEDIGFPVKKLISPMDLPSFPHKLPVINRIFFGAMYLLNLESALKGYDLVCTRETYFHFTQQTLNAKKRKWVKKVLITCSETIPFNHEGIWGRKKYKQHAILEADHFHCLTQKAKQCLIAEGAASEKITVIGYGVDLKKFKKKTGYFEKKNKNLRLLFVGRLEEQKGIRELQPVYEKLKNEFPDLELHVIGRGGLKNLIDKSGAKVKSVSYPDMPKVYQESDIFILASKATKYWEEYYGMALLEAMATGLPIVTTDCGAIPEVVGKDALISPQGDKEILYKNLRRMIINESSRLNFGKKARKRAEKYFDCQKQAKKLSELWINVMKSKNH